MKKNFLMILNFITWGRGWCKRKEAIISGGKDLDGWFIVRNQIANREVFQNFPRVSFHDLILYLVIVFRCAGAGGKTGCGGREDSNKNIKRSEIHQN